MITGKIVRWLQNVITLLDCIQNGPIFVWDQNVQMFQLICIISKIFVFQLIMVVFNGCIIWGADVQKDFSPYIAAWLFGEQDTDRSILTGVYFWVRSLRYSGAVPLSTWNG